MGGALDDGAPINIRIYHSDSFDSCHNGDKWYCWHFWFEIPESFLREHWGFVMPKAAEIVEYSIDNGKTWGTVDWGKNIYRPIQTPKATELVLPEETMEARKARLQKMLEELGS